MADFFFKTTRIQALLISVPKSLRAISTLFLLTILFLIWFICVYKPLFRYNHQQQTHYTNIQSMHAIGNKTVEKTNKIEKLIKKKDTILTKNKKSIVVDSCNSPEEITNKIVATLFDYAHKSQLTVTRHTPLNSTETDWFLSFHTTNEFQGSFNSLLKFLQSLSDNSLGIHINNMSIGKQNDSSLILTLQYTINHLKESFNEKK